MTAINNEHMEEERYGIDKAGAHGRALELVPEDFFWDGVDQLSPFGSEEGDNALVEFRDWRMANPDAPLRDCLKRVIEDRTNSDVEGYNETLASKELLQKQVKDKNFDAERLIYDLDTAVIATGFAQLVDEGRIDEDCKAWIRLALDRQRVWAGLMKDWPYAKEYTEHLSVLDRVLKEA